MFRPLVFTVLLAVAPSLASAERVAPPPAKPAPVAAAPDAEFPLPKDAQAPAAVKGGGGKLATFQVPRGRDVVVGEVRKALEAGGWVITKDEAAPSGNAVRMVVRTGGKGGKGGKEWRASFTGDATRTVVILTRP